MTGYDQEKAVDAKKATMELIRLLGECIDPNLPIPTKEQVKELRKAAEDAYAKTKLATGLTPAREAANLRRREKRQRDVEQGWEKCDTTCRGCGKRRVRCQSHNDGLGCDYFYRCSCGRSWWVKEETR